MDEALNQLAAHVAASTGGAVTGTTVRLGELTLETTPGRLLDLLGFLKKDARCGFAQLVTICGADYPGRERRFEVIYHLLSLKLNHRVRVKLATDEDTPVPSAAPVYESAPWFERETWDMYGVWFSDHPDLRRILTDYGFEGHPLRKDFPLTGFVEMRYDEQQKRVVYEPVKLTQEFRRFDFLSPWEGAKYVLPGDEKATKA